MHAGEPMPATNPSHRPKPRRIWWRGWVASIFIFALLVICVKPPPDDDASSSSAASTPAIASAGGDALVKCVLVTPFENDGKIAANGTLEIAVHRGLAPLASDAFLRMVSSYHFDQNYIFRAVKGFVVQWGIESPKGNKKGRAKFPKAGIDPPPAADNIDNILRSNVRGALNFAGGNSAVGQVYVNMGTNSHLNREPGSLPFATLDERSMEILDSVHSYKEGLGQVRAVLSGDEEVKRLFPQMSRIERCWIDHSSEKSINNL